MVSSIDLNFIVFLFSKATRYDAKEFAIQLFTTYLRSFLYVGCGSFISSASTKQLTVKSVVTYSSVAIFESFFDYICWLGI